MQLESHTFKTDCFDLWFGFVAILQPGMEYLHKDYLEHLSSRGIENRPIISGNFVNQPSIKLYKLNQKNEKFKHAQEIEERGFFIGLHTEKIKKEEIDLLKEKLLNIK